MRALLDVMRENEAKASVQNSATFFAALLWNASKDLTVLDPEVGEKELINAVAAALAKLPPALAKLPPMS